MAVQYNNFNNIAVVPKLPTLPQYQPKQPTSNNNDPSAYYTKALGFLPIDVRYMANPTNSLAYNSMADVIFNHRAWRERWGHDSWLNTPLGYIPRLFADTFLLFKHQTLDPMVQGAIDDGWSGFLRGSSTAMMNGLVNLGNTLDIVSNPIKGLVLEGGDGFVKGLVGDHKGRKQYDYTDYIDTGSGVADFILSMGAEIISDPLNWISWGSKAAIGTSAKTVANVAVDTISETVESVLKNTAKATIDDVAEALVKNTALSMDDAVAKTVATSLAKDVTDEATGVVTKQITKESADEVLTGLSDRLASALKRIGSQPSKKMSNTAQQLAESLVNGKTTRFKASLFKKAQPYTSAQQQIVASYLNNLDVSKLPTRFLTGNKIFNAVNNFERGLRYTAGATGIDLFVGGNVLRKYIGGRINNARALKESEAIFKYTADFADELQFKIDTAEIVPDNVAAVIKTHQKAFKALSKHKDMFTQKLLNLKPEDRTIDNITKILQEGLRDINSVIKKQDLGFGSLNEYLTYLKKYESTTGSRVFADNIKQLEALQQILSPDLTNKVVFRQYVGGIKYLKKSLHTILGEQRMLTRKPKDWGVGDKYVNYYIKDGNSYKQLTKWPDEWKSKTYYQHYDQQKNLERYRRLPKKIQKMENTLSDYYTQLDKAVYDIVNISDGGYTYLVKQPTDWGKPGLFKKYYTQQDGKFIPLSKWPEEFTPEKYYRKRLRLSKNAETIVDDTVQIAKAVLNSKQTAKDLPTFASKRLLKRKPKNWGVGDGYLKYYIKDGNSYKQLKSWPEEWMSGKYYIHTDPALRGVLLETLPDYTPAQLLDHYYDSFKTALKEFTEDPDNVTAKSKLVQSYQDLTKYLRSLNKMPEYNINTMRIAKNNFGKKAYSAGILEEDFDIRDITSGSTKAYNTFLEVEKAINKNTELKDMYTRLKESKASLDARIAWVKKMYDDGKSGGGELRYDKEFEDIILTSKKDYAIEEASFIEKLEEVLGHDAAYVFKNRSSLKAADTAKNINIVYKNTYNDTLTLSDLIDDLPVFNLKAIDKVINVEDYVKYKLVTYSLIQRKANLFHELLGITDTGIINKSVINEVELKHTFNEQAFKSEFKDVFQLIQDARLIDSQTEYLIPGQESVFYKELKKVAETLYNIFDSPTMQDLYYLITDNKVVPTEFTQRVKEYYTAVLEHITKYMAENPDAISVGEGITNYINTLIKIADTGHFPTELIHRFNNLRGQCEHLLYADIVELSEFIDVSSEITSTTGAALGRLIDAYNDKSSLLYTALNSDVYSVSELKTIVEPVRNLLIRGQQYRTLVSNIIQIIDARGYGKLYKEAAMDSLNNLLSKPVYASSLDTLVDDFISRIEVFIKNRTAVSSSKMDSILPNIVNEFKNNKAKYSIDLLSTVSDIEHSLTSGLAHGAVTDVDNWVRLLTLSKHTSNKQVYGLLNDLINKANGRRIIVFDIETTGAKEASAIPFQISGKILNPDGTAVPGSEFNYIIKPPKGVKPLPSVLEKLAPAGVDPNKWWLDNIVNAKTIVGQQTVFDSIEDAIDNFITVCNKNTDTGFILAGQNIKTFDLDMLSKRGNKDAKKFFKGLNRSKDVFDSLEFFNRNTMFSAQGPVRQRLAVEIKDLFETLLDDNAILFKRGLFDYTDVKALSDFKKLFSEQSSLEYKSTSYISKTLDETVDAQEALDAQETVLSHFDPNSGVLMTDALGIEDAISQIVTTWRTPPKLRGTNYITISNLDANSLEKSTKKLMLELEAQGLVDMQTGKNIMQILNTDVAAGNIILNPKRVLSYEVFDIFDKDKCLKHFTTFGNNSVSFNTMYRLTRMMRSIKNIRVYQTDDVVKEVLPTAESFLKTIKEYQGTRSIKIGNVDKTTGKKSIEKLVYEPDSVNTLNSFVNSLYDDADDLTKVSCAVYFYNKIKDSAFIKEHPEFKTLGDLRAVKRRLNGNVDFEPTALGYSSSKTNPITGQPQWIYEDYSWAELAKTNKNNPLGAIRKFNTHHHLYNIDEAARFKLCTEDFEFAQRFEDCLNKVTEGRSELELRIKHYNDVLDRAEIDEVLTRSDRVTAFKAEAKLRAGHFYFETTDEIDLSDFSAVEDLIVISNKLTDRDTYAHFIGVKREFFDTTAEVTLPVRMVESSTLPKDVFDLITEGRQRMSRVMKNIGYSRGDELTAETIDNIHDTLRRLGVDDNTLALLPDGDYLKASEYFNTLRVNHSVVGNQQVWQFVMDDPDFFRTSDPIKQLLYNTKAVVGKRLDSLTGYANLICNEWNCINTKGGLFDSLSNADLYELLKNNSDFGIYYIKKAGKLDKTSTGCVVKELQLVNKNTIDVAKKINAYILPRTHARQLMGAFNKFELPPVAKFFKDISDVYKVAYLGSIGFLIRNFIDSNYKTYVGLNGEVSLPTQLKQFFSSIKLIKRHTTIGREYTARMGKDFKNDLEYDVFNKYCHRYTEDNIAEKIASEYGEKHHNKIVKYVNELSEKFTDTAVLQSLQKQLLDTNMFSIMNVFIKSGPSTGMSKSVLDNIISSNKTKDLSALQKFNKFMTEDTPSKYVYGINDYIEQAARLSMFLADLERGSGIDEAIRNIVKTHFDYSDKSLGMLYTEIVFPFMSFSYKNMEFWIEYMYRNPMFVGQLENIFRPIMNYHSVFEPNQEAYESFDYKFDWSKDVWSFQARAPWTTINAARLYHLLAGNIVIDSGKDVKHNAGYGYKDNDLFYVFKLSPSVLDAVKMLYNPLSSYSERMLPPYEALLNGMVSALNGTIDSTEINTTSLMNILPYTDVIAQRVGLQGNFGLKHNNIGQRISDGGPLMAIGSTFGLAYAPKKTNNYWYDSDYNILGGFKTNYYAKRIYANPCDSVVPRYTIRRMSQNKKPRDIYTPTKKTRVKKQIIPTQVARYSDNILKLRIKDYKYYL